MRGRSLLSDEIVLEEVDDTTYLGFRRDISGGARLWFFFNIYMREIDEEEFGNRRGVWENFLGFGLSNIEGG
jgi:hypothetical protein